MDKIVSWDSPMAMPQVMGPNYFVIEELVWKDWVDRFIKVIISEKCYRFKTKKTSIDVQIVDRGSETGLLTWWGIEEIFHMVFQHTEVVDYLGTQILHPIFNVPNKTNAINDAVFYALRTSSEVKSKLTELAMTEKQRHIDSTLRLRESIKSDLNRHNEEQFGICPRFVSNNDSPHELYYVVGDILYFIPNIVKYEKDQIAIKIGHIEEI